MTDHTPSHTSLEDVEAALEDLDDAFPTIDDLDVAFPTIADLEALTGETSDV